MSVIHEDSQWLLNPYAVEGPIITEFKKLLSRLILLGVTDLNLVNQALCDMDEYFSKHEQQFLELILPDRLIGSLINLLVSLKSMFVSHKVILKLLAKLLSFESFVPLFEPFIKQLGILIDLFTTTEDKIIEEQTSYIISKLMSYNFVKKELCTNVVFEKLFNMLENCTERDIVCNCIMIFKILADSIESQAYISQDFKPLFLINRIKDMNYQDLILNLLDVLAELKSDGFFTVVFSTQLLKHLFGILMQQEWSDVQNRVMQLLYKCVVYDDPVFVEMLYNHLLAFTTFALESTSCHALACVTLFAEYTNIELACHLLVDEELHHKLTLFYDINCEFIEIKLCTIIGNICSECDLSEDKYRDYYLILFMDLIGRKRLSWEPYRQAALHPIHAFLARNKSVARFYFEKGLFPFLKAGVRFRDKLSKTCFGKLLEVYEMLVNLNTKYLQLMLPQDIYEILFMLFKTCIESNESEHYICCCNIIFYSFALKIFQKRFLKNTGFEFICSAMSKYKQNVHLHLLEFVYMSTACEEFACALMHRDIINILTSIIEDAKDLTSKKNHLCRSIMTNLKRYELMYKFSFFSTLSFNDHIESCFMVSAGSPPINLSFKHNNPFSRKRTVIVVNILTNVAREELVNTLEYPMEQSTMELAPQAQLRVSDQRRSSLAQSIAKELPPPPLKSALAKSSRRKKSIVMLADTSSAKYRVIGYQLPRYSLRLSSTSLLNGRGMYCSVPLDSKDGGSPASFDISQITGDMPFDNASKEFMKHDVSKESMKKSSSKHSTTKANIVHRQSSTKDNTNKKSHLNTGTRYSTNQGESIYSMHSVNNADNISDIIAYEEDDILSVVSEDEDNGVQQSKTECRFELIEKVKRLERDEPLQFFIYECKKIIGVRRHRPELVKWQGIATYVDELYTPTGGYTERKYHTHINIIKGIFKTCYLSIGYIRVGSICERAIMFKLICDSMYLPCELKKDPDYDDILWIEVPVHYKNFELKIHSSCRQPIDKNESDESKQYDRKGTEEYHNCIIDLINNVGALYPIDSDAARKYRSPRIFEYDSEDSVSSIGF